MARQQILHHLVQTFIETTTMRGFGKFVRTPHLAMKFLWFAYIVSMITLLMFSSYLLIGEYFSFHTTVQSGEIVHDITDLPSITVCSQSPIGKQVISLWQNSTLISPSDLSLRIRRAMLLAYQRHDIGVAADLFFADRLSTYIQNIPLTYLRTIGLQSDELVLFCVMRHSKNNNPSVSHDEVCQMRLRWIRHPIYANCYEIIINEQQSRHVSSVSLVLQGGRFPANMNMPLDSHVHDVFTQSKGLRITLHETGTHPEIDAKGVSVGLGKLTEIKYQTVKNDRLDLGVDGRVCKSTADAKVQRLRDFNRRFDYSYPACISEALGRIILNSCKCVSAFHLVDQLPNSTHPFCHFFDPDDLQDFQRRLQCVRNIEIPAKVHKIRETSCASRCEFKEFRMEVSSTNWMPTSWQLEFAMTITNAWDILASAHLSPNSSTVREAERDAIEFMTSSNLSHRHSNHKLDLEKLSLVTVSRLSYNTISKTETQQVTISALLSRIGGMGSLTIGCTLAFFFEIVELVFLFSRKVRDAKKESKSKSRAAGEVRDELDDNVVDNAVKVEQLPLKVMNSQ